jgi:hypothetical protein
LSNRADGWFLLPGVVSVAAAVPKFGVAAGMLAVAFARAAGHIDDENEARGLHPDDQVVREQVTNLDTHPAVERAGHQDLGKI